MSMLLPVNIAGVEYQAHAEYTSDRVSEEYKKSLAAFVAIFNLGLTSATGGSDANAAIDSGTYHTDLEFALTGGTLTSGDTVVGLLNLASDGITVNDDPVLLPGQRYLSIEMSSALDQLIRSLKLVGVPIAESGGKLVLNNPVTKDMVKNWRNYAASSTEIQEIINLSISAAEAQNRTLQALVELIYVKTGNEILSNSLERLEDALSGTKESLNILSSLQNIHNKLTAEEKVSFKEAYQFLYKQPTATGFVRGDPTQVLPYTLPGGSSIVTDLVTAQDLVVISGVTYSIPGTAKEDKGIIKAADIYFSAVDPKIQGSITADDRTSFMSLRNQLVEQIAVLSGQTPDPQEGTLVDRLRTVLGGMNKALSAAGSSTAPSAVSRAVLRWILDNYSQNETSATAVIDGADVTLTLGAGFGGLSRGQIQRDITAAITAGQSINDTQKEEVRRYLFVFEEYYKSASAILQKITQILERMAQTIGR